MEVGPEWSEGRLTAASSVEDLPLDVQTDEGHAYLPENINRTFLGPMLVREALGNSRNIPAMRALQDVGVERMLRWFDHAGVRRIDDGTVEITREAHRGHVVAFREESDDRLGFPDFTETAANEKALRALVDAGHEVALVVRVGWREDNAEYRHTIDHEADRHRRASMAGDERARAVELAVTPPGRSSPDA